MEYPSIIDIRDACTGCGACAAVCMRECITMTEDENGFYYPRVDINSCVMCGACSNSCHVISNSVGHDAPMWLDKSEFYVYQSKDKQLLEKSTSGGAFSFFASKVLEKGGIVFASRYNGTTEHLEFADTDHFDIDVFRKSRYMESNTNSVFPLIKSHLLSGRIVLFCGTPCQVAGLIRFLGRVNRERLITINFICHGVPSNKHFHQWLHTKYPTIKSINNVDFRYKNKKEGWGWHDMCLSIKEESGRMTVIPYTQSSYYLSFNNNDFLRKCCYNCKIINEISADITLGDFWGVNKTSTITDDNTGLSLLILHSEKVKSFLPSLKIEGLFRSLEYKDIEYAFPQRNYSRSKRSDFEEGIRKYGYVNYLDRKYRKYILKYQIERLLSIHKLLKWLRR